MFYFGIKNSPIAKAEIQFMNLFNETISCQPERKVKIFSYRNSR